MMDNLYNEPNLSTNDKIESSIDKNNFNWNNNGKNEKPYINSNQNQEDVVLRQRISTSVAVIHLVTENLLSHPFIVLRRQCQVNHIAKNYHLLPHTIIPILYGFHQEQGLSGLWKGLGSTLIVKGIYFGAQDLLSRITPWPKEINWAINLKKSMRHILLKATSFAISTPFLVASIVETVQSELASYKPEIWEIFREGFMRLLVWNSSNKSRMIPIWSLIMPTVALGLSKYLLTEIVRGLTIQILYIKYRKRHEAYGAIPRHNEQTIEMTNIQVTASLIANLATDIIFYPCETIMLRLYLQGTRTIVDNLDNGRSVIPIITNYTGLLDCYRYCIEKEGKAGLYKGFGVLIMQYTTHAALIQFSRFSMTQICNFITKRKKPSMKIGGPSDVSPVAFSNLSEIHRSYLLP